MHSLGGSWGVLLQEIFAIFRPFGHNFDGFYSHGMLLESLHASSHHLVDSWIKRMRIFYVLMVRSLGQRGGFAAVYGTSGQYGIPPGYIPDTHCVLYMYASLDALWAASLHTGEPVHRTSP